MSEEKEVADGARIDALLKDESVIAAFALLDKRYWTSFKTCRDDTERNQLGARASALEDLKNELQVIVDAGIRANATLQGRERRARR